MTATVPALSGFPAPRDPARPLDPAPEYRALLAGARAPEVMLPVGRTARLVGRMADVRAVLAGSVSASGAHESFPMARAGKASGGGALSFLRMDGAEHRRYRRLTTGHFTVGRSEALRPALQSTVDELLDRLERREPPVDLVQELAMAVPGQAICGILGVPYADRAHFHGLSEVLARGAEYGPDRFFAAVMELRDYVQALADRRRAEPADDLLSHLTAAFDADEEKDPKQLAGIALLLLVAGHETTASMISLGTLALLGEPAQRELLVAEPDVVPNAVEELLRYLSVAQWIPRVATEDVVLGDEVVPAGAGVVLLPPMANRDPAVFERPDELDLRRPEAHRHVAFGFGPHQCLGQQLARMELQVVFGSLFRRLPGLELAVPAESLRFKEQASMFGVEELPVRW